MRPKVFLAILVGLALLMSFGMTVKDAQADAIMFPWVTKSATVSTIISVVNLAAPDYSTDNPQPELLHYQYWHKIPSPYTSDVNHQRNVCDEFDFKAYISKDDLVSFDSSGKINDGLPLWNDNDPLHPNDTIFVSDYRLDIDDPVRAFLLIDNNTPNYAITANTNTDGTLYGEALVLEITTGAAWGYIAYNASGGTTSYQDDAVYFEDGLDYLGEVLGSSEETQTIILNPNSVTTKFFITPLTDDEDDTIGVLGARSPNSNTRVQLCKRTTDQDGTCQSGGMFDNVEGTVSFTNPKDIVCTSADSLEALMGTSSFNSFRDSGRSGWAWIITSLGTVDQLPANGIPDNPCDDVIIGKLEYTDTSLDIDGMTIPTQPGVAGGINSFLWLRDSETTCGEYGTNFIHNEQP
jgi:hypothetical protein